MRPSIWFMISNSPLFTAEGLGGLIFLCMIGITVVGALIATSAARLVRCVSGLAMCFIGLAGLFYYLNSPFVALMEILIYVGAVCVAISFGIMLAEPRQEEQVGKGNALVGPLSFIVGGMFFFGLVKLVGRAQWMTPATKLNDGSMAEIGKSLLTTYSMVFELISLVLLVSIIGALVLGRAGRGRI